jgi:hypothetical protein
MERSVEHLPQEGFVASQQVEEEEVVALEFERDVISIRLGEDGWEDSFIPQFLRVKQAPYQPRLPSPRPGVPCR